MLFEIQSPLNQFEIRDLLSIHLPIIADINVSITNIGLYITLATCIILSFSLLSDNNDKLITNN